MLHMTLRIAHIYFKIQVVVPETSLFICSENLGSLQHDHPQKNFEVAVQGVKMAKVVPFIRQQNFDYFCKGRRIIVKSLPRM